MQGAAIPRLQMNPGIRKKRSQKGTLQIKKIGMGYLE